MQLTLFIILALVLVTVIIVVLHTRQMQRTRDIADQGMPLPPLDTTASQPTPPAKAPVTVSPALAANTSAATNWRDEVKSLRDAGRFREALAVCSRQYPRMLAFRQTMITLRSQLKAGSEQPEHALQEIYRTAILAGLAKAAPQASKAGNPDPALPELDNPRQFWDQLGYEQLELLSKTDCTLLIKYWGEPNNHNNINSLLTSGASHTH